MSMDPSGSSRFDKIEMMLVALIEALDRMETQGDRRLTEIERRLDVILEAMEDEE